MTENSRLHRFGTRGLAAGAVVLLTGTTVAMAATSTLTLKGGDSASVTCEGSRLTYTSNGTTSGSLVCVPNTTAPVTFPGSGPLAIAYGAGWESGANGDRYTTKAGSTLTVKFSGGEVSLFGVVDGHHANATVTIDGKAAGTTNSKGLPRTTRDIYSRTGLGAGDHTLVLTSTGTVSVYRAAADASTTGATTPTPNPTTTRPTPTTNPTTPPPTTNPPTSNPPSSAKAVTRVGNTLQVGGKETWFLGYNSFTMNTGCGTSAEVAAARSDGKAFINSMRTDGHGILRLFYWSGYSEGVKAYTKELVDYAAARNVYTILTLSDGQKGCGNAGPGTLTTNNYAHVREAATRFRNNDGVAFFEVANEPTQADWDANFLDKARQTSAVIKSVDSDRLVGTGTQAAYFLGGGSNAESERRYAQLNALPGIDVASLHGYEEGCDESRTRRSIELASGKPVIMGEFGVLANSGSFARRAQLFQCKINTWAKYPGLAAALGWAWQPGNGGSANEYGNLDADAASQRVLREGSLAG